MKLGLIAFQPFTEQMYPHLYDVIKLLQAQNEVALFDQDDRGLCLFALGEAFKFKPRKIANFPRRLFHLFKYIIRLKKFLKASNVEKLICVDDNAFFFCRLLKPKCEIILWSHDIISEGNEWLNSPLIKFMVNSNGKVINHHKLIIQCKRRLELYTRTAGIQPSKSYLLPVSISPVSFERRKNSPMRLMQLSPSQRKASEILGDHYINLPAKHYQIHFHGHIPKEFERKYSNRAGIEFTHISEDFVHMRKMISNADIGFLAYTNVSDLNFSLMSFAFGQMVEFLAQGIPVIIFHHREVGEFATQKGFGIFINDIKEIDHAINLISDSYESYSQKSKEAFDQYFDLSNYSQSIQNFISG